MHNILTIDDNGAGDTETLSSEQKRSGEEGFSLIETTCALVIILIALLGVAFSFTYAINYNAGNQSRTESLAVLQQEIEQMRAAKFTPTVTDIGLSGGPKSPRLTTSPTGSRFMINVSVDNNPDLAGTQNDIDVPAPTIKEITVSVRLQAPSPGWQTAIPSVVVLRRVRAN